MNSYQAVGGVGYQRFRRRVIEAIKTLGRHVRGVSAVPVGAALVLGLLAFPVQGRAANGLVVGTAHDSASGKPLAQAQIVAHNLDKNTVDATVTDSEGIFTFTNLGPGRYEFTAKKSGFQESVAKVEVAAHQTIRVDLPLETITASHPAAENPDKESSTEREQELLERIERLEARLATTNATSPQAEPLEASLTPIGVPPTASTLPSPTTPLPQPAAAAPAPPQAAAPAPAPTYPEALQEPPATTGVDNVTPFAYADFSWKNGTGRGTSVFTTKFFTPEIRFDTHYMESFNQPRDHTLGGATESFRSGEIQLEQVSVGGDFRWGQVRGRLLTMDGLFATTTPRNDASPGVGQWDVRGAYKYFSEAWGGYSFNVNHGLNVDAGIFVSYIGLFSYYNFDNWTYQPSYVSSNTPWFFNGLRIQWFPTNKLKIEPWIINGWQSYNKYNGKPGLGGQILWSPTEWLSLVFNNYGMGTDTLNNPNVSRIHTDDSVNLRYYNHPTSAGLSKMAFSFTGDLGCEYGGGANCFHSNANGKITAFAGWMVYNRFWFSKDHHAFTVGGGQMTNPGRYLTLLQPINGADAISGSPYFTTNFGDPAKMWDTSVNYSWQPDNHFTWWLEGVYRHSNIPYWTGRGGITPPGGNTGSPASYVCTNGTFSGVSNFAPSGSGFAIDNTGNAVSTACTAQFGAGWNAWQPDLRLSQTTLSTGIMVRF
jgi:hypothetical protein